MKNCVKIPVMILMPVVIWALSGCQTEVIDVNAQLASLNAEESSLGTPVEYNENYIDVAYDPAKSPEAKQRAEEEAKEKELAELDEKENETKEEDRLAANDIKDKEDEENTEDSEEDEDADGEEKEDGEDEETEGEEGETDGEDNASVIPEEFDPVFYAETYPDVVAIYGDSPEALYKHYQEYGKAEGRSCNAEEYALLNENAGL